jgi:hypothetical protein
MHHIASLKGFQLNKQPAFFRLILTDYMAFMSVIFPVVSWGLYLYFLLSKRESLPDSSLPIVFGVISIIALFILIWRIVLINNVFAEGLEVNGTLSRVYFYRDRGRILFTFTYMGEIIHTGIMVMKNKRTKNLQPGMEMIVMVDQNHPTRAFIRDLYL